MAIAYSRVWLQSVMEKGWQMRVWSMAGYCVNGHGFLLPPLWSMADQRLKKHGWLMRA
jgi:hypothetical protein